MHPTNLASLIAEALADEPQKAVAVGLEIDDDDPPSKRWRLDRSDLLKEAGRWQARFRNVGLATGDRIGLSPSRGPEMLGLHLGALASGLVIVPLNSSLTASETDTLLATSAARLVVSSWQFAENKLTLNTTPELGWWIEDANEPLPSGLTLIPSTKDDTPLVPVDLAADHTALLLFTSGTTGQPKAVPLSHTNLATNLTALAELWQRGPEDRVLHILPAHHFHGLALGLYGTLLAGGKLFILPRFEPRAVLSAIRKYEPNILMGVPTMYARMITAALPDDDLSSLRLALCGSAPLPASVWEDFKARFGISIVERYGLTETGIIASNPPDSPLAGSVGQPLAGTELALRQDDDSYLLYDGTAGIGRGEICVRSQTVTSGYLGSDNANEEIFRQGWFHTGDLGWVNDDGRLFIDGRIKDLIIVGGSNVIPAEVEKALATGTGVQEIVAAGLPDDDLGEIVAAFVVSAGKGTRRKQVETALRNLAAANLSPYKRPRRYVFVDEVPRNAMGKIDRPRLVAHATEQN